MLSVAPGCLYIFRGEKVNRNSPRRSQLLSNCFRQFCNTDQASSDQASLPGFGTNPHILPGLPSSPSVSCFPGISHGKDTSGNHRPAVHQGKAQLRPQEHHGGLDEVLPKSQHAHCHHLQGLKETMGEITEGLTLPFQTTGIKLPMQLLIESASWAYQGIGCLGMVVTSFLK